MFALGVILILILTRVFDFSIKPASYKGLFINRPYCGLHSWANANRAWPARNHVKYGLGYTRGYHTLAVGDPPTAHPQRYVSHPSLMTLITAFGMLLFGAEEWQIRLFDLVLSVPVLLLILLLLRKLYGCGCALLSGLLLVILPISAYFGFDSLLVLAGLWALWRYLLLIGRLQSASRPRRRYILELAVALFLVVQLSWVGVFYAFAIGLHYVVSCLIRWKLQAGILAVLVLAPFMSLALNFYVMACGFRSNIQVEAATKSPVELKSERADTAWGLIKVLFKWRVREGERPSFSWRAWLARNAEYAKTNFTVPVLFLLTAYLIYWLIAHIIALLRIFNIQVKSPVWPVRIPRPFNCIWFFLLPGLLFLLTFKGLIWRHQYWQRPLVVFVAVGAALGVLIIGDLFYMLNRWLGRLIVAILVIVVVIYCNQGLAAYRAVRWQAPHTINLFKRLNREIPPDKALLTFKNFMIRQSKAKAPFYRPEYAWYLDREMVVANAWYHNPHWAESAPIVYIVDKTVDEIQKQAKTGRFHYYFVPEREEPRRDQPYNPLFEIHTVFTSMDARKLRRKLNDNDQSDDEILHWEKHRRYRVDLINKLKRFYHYEYYGNPAQPGDEDFCYWGNTPCYLFDLTRPKMYFL